MKSPKRLLATAMLVAAPLLAAMSFPTLAEGADVTHVVQKGDKIDDLAKKYGVTAKSIASANKLKDPSHLKPGVKLAIPGAKAAKTAAKTYESKPKNPGRVTLVRFGSAESQTIQLVTKKGKLVPGVLPRMARMMRFGKLNIEHPIDPKLVQLVAQVSDHFGGRNIEIISGFRPKTLTQYTPHSNHNVGKAIDMRMPGVPNEVLRDHCRTYKNVGVGYYPNSLFVHFDVRAKSTFWIDLSKPGEAPKYVGKDTDVDHSVDDATMDTDDAPAASSSASATTEKTSEKPPVLPAPTPSGSASGQK
jgi:uncharacterized protein YcbK (DUF882 family)